MNENSSTESLNLKLIQEITLICLNPDYRKCTSCGKYYSISKTCNHFIRVYSNLPQCVDWVCICCYKGHQHARFNLNTIEKTLNELKELYAPIYHFYHDNFGYIYIHIKKELKHANRITEGININKTKSGL